MSSRDLFHPSRTSVPAAVTRWRLLRWGHQAIGAVSCGVSVHSEIGILGRQRHAQPQGAGSDLDEELPGGLDEVAVELTRLRPVADHLDLGAAEDFHRWHAFLAPQYRPAERQPVAHGAGCEDGNVEGTVVRLRVE